MLSSIGRSVIRTPRYFTDVCKNNVRFICSNNVRKHCVDNGGCFKTRCDTRAFCSTVGSETEYVDVNETYANLITSPEVEKQIKMILLECELARQSDLRAPTSISEKDMKELLGLTSLHSKQKYFHYLKTKELMMMGDKIRKEKKQLAYQMRLEEKCRELESTGHLRYGLYHNSMYMYIRKTALSSFYKRNLCRAAMFEQPLVIDMDFEEEMNSREIKNTAKQLRDTYGYNRLNSEPFDLLFCNLKPQSQVLPHMLRHMPNITAGNSMITMEERSYLDLYPKEKLVYLSPNAPENLKDFDCDKIYIVGGLVDKQNEKPLTLAKAKREGIAVAKLPLDKYLLWGLGSKNLTINQVVLILLEWKKTNDWNKALKFVPRRKIKRAEDFVEEEEFRKLKLQKYKKRFESTPNKFMPTHRIKRTEEYGAMNEPEMEKFQRKSSDPTQNKKFWTQRKVRSLFDDD